MGIRESFVLTLDDLTRSPFDLFTFCEDAMACRPNAKSTDKRLWNQQTQASYHRMMETMQKLYFDSLGLSFGELEFEHFLGAVDAYANQSHPKATRKKGTISESTQNKLSGILKSLSSFVHEKIPQYSDPCWGSIWNYRPLAAPHNYANKSKTELRQTRTQEIEEIVRLPRSLQIREEIQFARTLREKISEPDGAAIGGLLMLYLGLRPSECCGLTYGAIKPLSGETSVNTLYIYRALDTANKNKHQLKTKNAYRVLPISDELNDLLQTRKRYIEEHLEPHLLRSLQYLPIVNSAADFTQPCSRKHFGASITNLLRDIRANEQSLSYASYLLRTDTSVREESPTAYLLRRHYATILSSVCLMNEEELQYLMGHEIRNADIRHTDVLNADWLLHMHKKLNRRHIFTEVSAVSPQQSYVQDNLGDCQLSFGEASFQQNTCFRVDIWNDCPADALTLRVKCETGVSKKAVFYESDYRPVPSSAPFLIRFDRAYYRALQKSANKSAGHTKKR